MNEGEEEKQPLTQAEKIQQVFEWILDGGTEHAIRDTLATSLPEDDASELINLAHEQIRLAGGFHAAAAKHIYHRMIGTGDYSGALRAVQKVQDTIPQGVPAVAPFQIDPDTAELLSEISLTASPEEQAAAAQAAADYIPKGKRLPNVGQTSREELEFRYAQVAKWISLSKKKGEIKKLAYQEWGIKPRTFENYYTAAYKILAAEADTTPDEQFQKSVRFYELVIADDDAEFKDKIAARKALDELLGIQKPRKTAQVGANGQVVDPVTGGDVVNLTLVVGRMADASEDQLKKLIAAGEVYESIVNGKTSATNGSSDTPSQSH